MPIFKLNKIQNPNAYAPEHFLEFIDIELWKKDGVSLYDTSTSMFLDKLSKLSPYGSYPITIPFRPDVYSYDIYGTTSYWWVLLAYNNIVSMSSLELNRELNFPSFIDLENIMLTMGTKK